MTANDLSRREMLSATALTAGTLAAAAMPTASVLAADAGKEGAAVKPEYYELRCLRLRRGPMGKRLDEYLKEAFIPAARRAGCGPVGVFNVTIGVGNPSVYVLIPHPTLASFESMSEKLAGDAEYHKAADAFRSLPATDPPYVIQEIQLLKAFPHFAKIEVPEAKPRIFELRTYRSHSKSAGQKKIEMFDTAGEVAIFKRVGLTPVFFAQSLTGANLPNLTYMLTFPDLATREKNWNTFRSDPEWKKLSTTPGYTDAEIVVDINNQILAPAGYSQV